MFKATDFKFGMHVPSGSLE